MQHTYESGFESVFEDSDALRALAERPDAREVLLELQASGWGVTEGGVYEEWSLVVHPGSLLEAKEFGGEGFPNQFHEIMEEPHGTNP